MSKNIFTSESVTSGHPDKVCDQIADRILDKILYKDPDAHVACEVTVCTDNVHIFGEVSSDADIDYEDVCRQVISEIGYTKKNKGFDAETCKITIDLHKQSPDIARGINRKGAFVDRLNAGAGDQGMMFGYACTQTDALMPMPIELAHMLTKRLEHVRRNGELEFLLPDGKAQVSLEYINNVPRRISSVVVSAQHEEDIGIEELRELINSHVIYPTLNKDMIDPDTHIYINPTGRFVQGGPSADSGLTGRKLIVDTYGGYARHGGGALSGKDASKVDRSGAYMARYLAKNIVSQGLSDQCEVQISYAIGLADPMSVRVDTFNNNKELDEKICDAIIDKIDLRPAAIIERFDMKKSIFSKTSCYGHFGTNTLDMPWEKTDLCSIF